jgi:hypothetical protein
LIAVDRRPIDKGNSTTCNDVFHIGDRAMNQELSHNILIAKGLNNGDGYRKASFDESF